MFNYLFRLRSNEVVLEGSTVTKKLTAGVHQFRVVCDFATKTRDIYIDGETLVENETMHSATNFYPQAVNDLLRINVLETTAAFNIDNICIYEVK